MKIKIILFLFIGFATLLKSQSSFEIIIEKPDMEVMTQTIETQDGEYLSFGTVAAIGDTGHYSFPILLQYSGLYDTNYISLPKSDTSYGFNEGFQKENGNYLFLGAIRNDPSSNLSTYICEYTPDFDLVWEKQYPILEAYEVGVADYLIDDDNNIVVFGSLRDPPYSPEYLYMTKYNMQGDLLIEHYAPEFMVESYNAFILKPDNTGYYILGDIIEVGVSSVGWLEIDKELNLYPSESSIFGGENYLMPPMTAKWLSDGNLLIANSESQETPNAYLDLEMRLVSPDFLTIKDTVILDSDMDYIPVHQGMDFVDEDLIWVSTFDYTFPHISGTEFFKVYLYNSEMELLGMKAYGGDSRWWFEHLMATSDGGCILTGIIREPDATTYREMDIYILKLMPDDILTSSDETPMDNDRNVAIYPNPVQDVLCLESAQKNLEISIFDNTGKEVLRQKLQSFPRSILNMEGIKSGFYYYTIKNNNTIVQNGKFVKK